MGQRAAAGGSGWQVSRACQVGPAPPSCVPTSQRRLLSVGPPASWLVRNTSESPLPACV